MSDFVSGYPQKRDPVLPKEGEKTTFDITVGFGTFRAGVPAKTVVEALARHNRVYEALLKEVPTFRINKIVRELNN